MNKRLVFFLLCGMLGGVDSEASMRAFNGAVFVQRNHIFQGGTLSTTRLPSITECAHHCLRRKTCVSLTFCHLRQEQVKTCHLHNEGLLLMEEDSASLRPRSGCVFQQFRDFKDCSEQLRCMNGGKCQYDFGLGQLVCSCLPPYIGKYCEVRKPDHYFHNLGAEGNEKPASPDGYKGTSLEGRVTVNSGIQFWTVPVAGTYLMEVAGAAGADGKETPGGKGAYLSGNVTLKRGDRLEILVGQKGLCGVNKTSAGGGGGGTFVLGADGNIIAVAGGGGGGGGLASLSAGEGGQTSSKGSVSGGEDGRGGKVCSKENGINAGAGGGYKSNGSCANGPSCIPISCPSGGGSFQGGGGNGGSARPHDGAGGFGGGGAAFGSYPGGGGGYSGGGVNIDSNKGSAGGGGSLVTQQYWSRLRNFNQLHGFVNIKLL